MSKREKEIIKKCNKIFVKLTFIKAILSKQILQVNSIKPIISF